MGRREEGRDGEDKVEMEGRQRNEDEKGGRGVSVW